MRFCLPFLLALPALAAPDAIPTVRTSTVVRIDQRSGRLVRSVQVLRPAAVPASRESPSELNALIDRIAAEQGVEAPLVHSVIRAESNYNFYALSPKGAQGLMQLIPSTAQRFGVGNAFDPQQNIAGGVKYLKFLLGYYGGDYVKAIAAYNAGEEAVDRYGGVPPYAETRNYVSEVAKHLKAARLKQTKVLAVSPAPAAAGPVVNPIQASVGADGKIYYRTP